jgi:hypothetical protein
VGFSSFWNGTDYSQQDSPVVSVADGVTNGTTTVTSATAGFTAAMVGNGLNIASDSLYQIVAVNSATSVTVDRNTANGGAGRGLKVGGAGGMKGSIVSGLEPQEYGILVPGHVIWMRGTNSAGVATNYSGGSPHLTTSGQEENYIRVEGYSTVRGDGGIANTVQVATWSGAYLTVRGLHLSGTFGGATLQIGAAGQVIENLIVDATGTSGYALTNAGVVAIRRVWVKGGTNVAAVRDTSGSLYEYCRIDGGAGQAGISVESGLVSLNNCILNGGAVGVQINAVSGFLKARNSVFYGASSYGIDITPTALHFGQGSVVEGCIFDSNGVADIAWRQNAPNPVAAPGGLNWVNSAFKCNYFHTTAVRYLNMVAAPDDTALTASPFLSPATGDFNLNSTAGGGAVISASPCKESLPDGVNSAEIIGGFYGSLPVVTPAALTTLRNLWRLRTNEPFYTATNSGVPDVTVDAFLDWALQWLNRIARYHFTTDSTTLALVAGQQEYTPFTDLVEAVFVRYGDKQLQKGDVERWRGDDLEWDREPAGEPREFAQYGLSIIFRPTPSAEAVSANPICTARYISTPPSISANGPEQLPTQAYRIVVDYAAAAFFMSYPDTALAEAKVTALLKEAQEAAMLFKDEMARRSIAK